MEQTLGRYRILGELGRGAMGAVYRALDPMIDREVAIKTLLPDLPEEVVAEVRERFIREARSAGRLNHPNIVVIYDVGEHAGTAYMAMELLEGRTLQQVLKGGEKLPYASTAELCAQVADALDHAQRYSIVHRDVKPANIMVDAAGRAKLTDFGVAHLPTSEMTRTGATLGSPKYMSPEQVLGQTPDPRGDLFSLGVVLYEMLCGRHPFQRPNDTVFGLMHRIAGEPHLPLAEADPAVPSGFHRIVDKALAKNAAERYQRAAEMANDLRNWRALGTAETRTAPLDKTVRLAPAAPRKPAGADLLAEIDSFADRLDSIASERAAEEALKHREEKSRDPGWKFPEISHDPEPPAPVAAPAAAPASSGPRTALDLLKSRVPSAPAAPQVSAEERAIAELDTAMREADRYLSQVVAQINSVRPLSERAYDFMYLGRIPALFLSDASSNSSSGRAGTRSVCETIRLSFHATPAEPHTVTIQGTDDIGRCVRFLKNRKTAHKALAEKRNDFGVPTRAQITVTGALPCSVALRAHYEDLVVDVQLSDVRRLGAWQAEVRAADLAGAVDELVRYLLGVDDDFDRRLIRAG